MESESVSSKNNQYNSSNNLPKHVKKQVCDDIEAAGGIIEVVRDTNTGKQTFRQICDKNKSLYGTSGSAKRKQVRNLVHYWKKQHKEGNYERLVLKQYNVPSYSTRTCPPQTIANHQPPQASASDSNSSSSSSKSSEQEGPPPRQRSVRPKEGVTPPRHSGRPQEQVTPPRRLFSGRPQFVSPLQMTSRLQYPQSADSDHSHQLNTDEPEFNYSVQALVSHGVLIHGPGLSP